MRDTAGTASAPVRTPPVRQRAGGFSLKNHPLAGRSFGSEPGLHAYNPCMFNALNLMLGNAAIERITLLVNHVLGSEAVATERLRAHAGRCIQLHFDGWPAVLPPLPNTAFRVTPAGLMEWCGADELPAAVLRVGIDASNPALAMAQALTGERPKVDVAGDAAFAGDLNWLFDNLRWDVQDDLARLVGQAPAREIARVAGGIAAGMREAVRVFSGLAAPRR